MGHGHASGDEAVWPGRPTREQLQQLSGAGSKAAADALMAALETGELEGEWISLSELPALPRDLHVDLRTLERNLRSGLGRAARELVTPVLQLIASQDWSTFVCRDGSRSTEINVNGVEFRLGQPRLSVGALDDVSTSAIVLAPRPQGGAERGFWLLRRGPHHAVTQAASSLRAWVIVDDGVARCSVRWKETPFLHARVVLALSVDADGILGLCAQGGDGADLQPTRLDGVDLLVALATAEQALVGDDVLKISGDAVRFSVALGRSLRRHARAMHGALH